MSSGSWLYQIEKLCDGNYDARAIQMRSVLIHSGLWTYVSGETMAPEPTEPAASITEWQRKDEKALATIILSVKTSQLLHNKNCKISYDA